MVADPFEVLGDEQQVRDLADRRRVLDHVGHQHAENAVVEIVEQPVALAHQHRRVRVARGEGVEHVVDHFRRDPRHRRDHRNRLDLLLALDQRHALGDVLGIIADPLDHAGDLQRGDDIAQVAIDQLARGDDPDRQRLDLGLHRVDALVALADLRRERQCRRAAAR